MSRIVALLVLGCALVEVAQARIEFYCTRASEFDAIADPHKFNGAEMDFLPYFNGVGGWPTTLMESTFGSETIYVWGRFVDERPNTQIFFADLRARTADFSVDPFARQGGLDPITVSRVYRHWCDPPVGRPWRRWNNPLPVDLHTENATGALAVTADGIQFRPPGQPNRDLYDPATGTFLYGALQLTGEWPALGTLRIGLGLGLAARDDVHTTPEWVYWPEVRLNGDLLQPEFYAPATERPPTYEAVAIAVIPEPATLALLTLAVTGRRRC